jgi:hypothetical protein
MEKECFKCHRTLDITEFYTHQKMKDGHLNKCKDCTKKDVSERYRLVFEARAEYEKNRNKTKKRKMQVKLYTKRFRQKSPEKHRAHNLVASAIKRGLLAKPSVCSICGKDGIIHAHHEDYEKPLDVVWVCARCHRKITDGEIFSV